MPGLPVVSPLQNHAGGGGGQNIPFQTKTNWFFIINVLMFFFYKCCSCFKCWGFSNKVFLKIKSLKKKKKKKKKIINYERIYLCSGITCFISNLIFQKVVFLFCSHLHINYSGFFDKSSDRKTS